MNSVGKCLTSQAGRGLRMEQSSTILVYGVQKPGDPVWII